MSKLALWSTIAGTLRSEIAAGHYRPGDKLPTEAELSARFGVNRHTVRHALASLVQADIVHSRRGAGVFVIARPTEYPLSRRVRFHRNVEAAGQVPSRRFNRLETRPADADEARALALRQGQMVHVVEGVSLVDDQPVSVFRSVFPAARFPALTEVLPTLGSITAALSACGLNDYTRLETRLSAQLADAVLALALHLRPGAAVLRSEAVNIDTEGTPVERGTSWFAGERVTLTIAPD